MADTTQSEQLEKRAPETPAPDPIADRSMSGPLLVTALLLVVTLIWSLYDEVVGQRPWKSYQKSFVDSYSKYLEKARGRQHDHEKAVKESPEYQQLAAAYNDAEGAIKQQTAPIDEKVKKIDAKILDEITPPYQDTRSWIVAKTYQMEVTTSQTAKESIRRDVEKKKQETIKFRLTGDDGKQQQVSMTYSDLEALYNSLRDEKARLLAERVQITQPLEALRKKRDDYLQDHLLGLTEDQVGKLEDKMKSFKYEIRQINVAGVVVDRCESCHLGVREPINISASDMDDEGAFVSHTNRDWLKTHNPD